MRQHATTSSCRRSESAEQRRAACLTSFNPAARPLIGSLVGASRALTDLAESFPGLLFALATDFGTPARRIAAVHAVERGAPLRIAAETLGLPWWLRRLPAQAFVKPLGILPAEADFNERIGAHVPQGPSHSALWLGAVLLSARACHSEFALWVAGWAGRQPRLIARPTSEIMLRYLAAWAWYADKPETLCRKLMRRPWTPQMGIRRAVDELALWRRRLALELRLGAAPTPGFLGDGEALGHDFVALRTASDFVAEAEAMGNCLDQFSDRLESRRSHVFSIRKNGRRIADMEIGVADSDSRMPAILQLRGPRNRRASAETWQAAYAWLGSRSLKPLEIVPAELCSLEARRRACELWRPYLASRGEGDAAHELARLIGAEIGIAHEDLLVPQCSASLPPTRRKARPPGH